MRSWRGVILLLGSVLLALLVTGPRAAPAAVAAEQRPAGDISENLDWMLDQHWHVVNGMK